MHTYIARWCRDLFPEVCQTAYYLSINHPALSDDTLGENVTYPGIALSKEKIMRTRISDETRSPVNIGVQYRTVGCDQKSFGTTT